MTSEHKGLLLLPLAETEITLTVNKISALIHKYTKKNLKNIPEHTNAAQ
jgi:hypothetical protein